MRTLELSVYKSPIGEINLVFDDNDLVYLDFADNPERQQTLLTPRYREFELREIRETPVLHRMLDRYFAGEKEYFDGVTMATGGTDFQRSVWKQLQTIKRGETLDYSSLAKRTGKPDAVRAAASSNARNPISIIIPCHRVIGTDRSLTGFGGGLDTKRFLLDHERRVAGREGEQGLLPF